MHTQVAIIGAGPAGLLLARLLENSGIDTLLLERRSPDYVLSRIRAGVLEQGTAELLDLAGTGARMRAEGLVHKGVEIGFTGERHRIDFDGLVGRSVIVYGQTEVTRDLMEARAAAGAKSTYEAGYVTIHDFDGAAPLVRYEKDGATHEVRCDVIAGCDGFHGVCRASVPERALQTFERSYPFGWLGVMVDRPPVAPELIYARHERGFALCSMRSAKRSRYYIQCAADEDPKAWSDEAFFDELRRRLDPEAAEALQTGPTIEKSVAPLRSFVAEPVRFGRLFLAGDACHIVPPTGAKGLNLAAADVRCLAQALVEFFEEGSESGLDHYSDRVLERVWKTERFSWWMTRMLHHFPGDDGFEEKIQRAEFEHLRDSRAAALAFSEIYTGLPFGDGLSP